jgi:hypothetical protein
MGVVSGCGVGDLRSGVGPGAGISRGHSSREFPAEGFIFCTRQRRDTCSGGVHSGAGELACGVAEDLYGPCRY